MSYYQRMLALDEELKATGRQQQSTQATPIEQTTDSSGMSEEARTNYDTADFNYAMDTTESFASNIGSYLDARFPLGNLTFEGYKSPTELYGEDFMDLSVDERRVRMNQVKAEYNAAKYPVITEMKRAGEYKAGAGGLAGSIVKTLADPTTLIPVGQTIKAGTIIGGSIGAAYSIAEDLVADEGEIDPKKAATYGALAGVGTAAFMGVMKVGGNAMKARKEAQQVKAADARVGEINLATAKAVANDIPEEQIPAFVRAETGLDAEDVTELLMTANVRLEMPKDKAAARLVTELEEMSTTTDRGQFAAFFDDILGSVSTRTKELSAPVMNKLRKLDFDTSVQTHRYIERTENFRKAYMKVPRADRGKLALALDNSDTAAAKSILIKHNGEEGLKAFNDVRSVLDDLHKGLDDAGLKLNKLENYFPRNVKNPDKFIKSLGGNLRGKIEKQLYDKARSLKLAGIHQLEPEIKATVINQVIRGVGGKGGKAGYQQERTINQVTEDMLKYYDSPINALDNYVRRTVADIEKRKFLGRDNVVSKGEKWKIDIDDSVGAFIAKEINTGNASYKVADELADIVALRIGQGEKQPHWFIRKLRDIGYATTLANPVSASIQFGDLGAAAYQNKVRNTAVGMLKGDKRVSMKELGLDDLISSELNAAMDTSRFLGNALKYSGFRAADRIGKNAVLRGAYVKATNMAKTKEGVRELAKKYRKQFGTEEFNKLIDELNADQVTDRVKFYLWNELADVQPISLAEMPKKYLAAPNGRILYALKSFTIKQLDMVRRGVYQELRAGNKKQAAKNAVAFATLVGGTNSIVEGLKDVALGRKDMDAFIEEVDDGIVEHIARTMFFDRYNREKFGEQGNLTGGIVNLLAPPMSYINAPIQDAMALASEDGLPENRPVPFGRTISQVPLFGRVFDNFFNGGLERAIERRERREYDNF